MRKLILVAAAALALAAPGLARADDGAPAGFFDKNYRLDVTLQDWTSPTFDATLNEVPSSVPYEAASYISLKLAYSTFEIDSSHATCFVVASSATKVPCAKLGELVDTAPDGGVYAIALAKPVANPDGSLRFDAKKITVWVGSDGQDVQSPADDGTTDGPATVPAPPKLFKKNIRVNLNLEDSSALVFDGSLNDIVSKVPQSWSDYLHQELDYATFEIDARKATCFAIKHGVGSAIPCSTLADLVDASPDGGVDVVAQGRLVDGGADGLSFAAKKITVWL
jgi:hypothetical protein